MNDFRMPKKDRKRRMPRRAADRLKTSWTASAGKTPPATAAHVLELLDHATGSRDEFKLIAIRAVRRANAAALNAAEAK